MTCSLLIRSDIAFSCSFFKSNPHPIFSQASLIERKELCVLVGCWGAVGTGEGKPCKATTYTAAGLLIYAVEVLVDYNPSGS